MKTENKYERNGVVSFFHHILINRRRSLLVKLLSVYLLPLSIIYLFIITLKRATSKPKKYSFPIISVGNILVGGTGKTPLVAYLCNKFRSNNKVVLIVSSAVVESTKTKFNIDRNDEIIMLRNRFPKALFSSKKDISLRNIEKKPISKNLVAIIDDGFQTYRIKKDIDIVLIDASNPFDNRLVIPSGFLREPFYYAKRADIFVITHPYMVSKECLANLSKRLKKFNKPVYIMDYKIKGLRNSKDSIDIKEIAGKKITAVAGIGNPLNFFSLLKKLSPSKIYTHIYPDHFSYTQKDIENISKEYIANKVAYIITTEKDYVKLKKNLGNLPVYYLDIYSVINNFSEESDFDTLIDSMLK
ncbi:tetraacyldisaccharide 4'-kinase [bacterium]|nr:tetraacyldisaccharide 4'-kinase [bacterium]